MSAGLAVGAVTFSEQLPLNNKKIFQLYWHFCTLFGELSLFLFPSTPPVKVDRARPFLSAGEMHPEKEFWSNPGTLLVLTFCSVWVMVALWLPLLGSGSWPAKGIIKLRLCPEQVIFGVGGIERGDGSPYFPPPPNQQAVETQKLFLARGSPESWAVNTRLVFPPQLFAAVHVVTHIKDENGYQRVMEAHLEKLL